MRGRRLERLLFAGLQVRLVEELQAGMGSVVVGVGHGVMMIMLRLW